MSHLERVAECKGYIKESRCNSSCICIKALHIASPLIPGCSRYTNTFWYHSWADDCTEEYCDKVTAAHEQNDPIPCGLSSRCIFDNILNDITCAENAQCSSAPYDNGRSSVLGGVEPTLNGPVPFIYIHDTQYTQ